MIDFSSETYANILKELKDDVELNIDKRETSPIVTSFMPVARKLSNVYEDLEKIQLNNFVLTASGEDLDLLVFQRGVIRKEATSAQRKLITNVKIDANLQFGTIRTDGTDNLIYISSDDSSLNSDTNLYETTVACETAGSIGNDYYGDVLPFLPINDLTTCYINDIVVAGVDTESDTSLRTRYLDSLASEAFGGNITAYRTYALSISGVGAVQVWPHYNGPGTVKLSILDGNLEPATTSLIETVQNNICPPESGSNEPSPLGFGMAPIGAKVVVQTGMNKVLNIAFRVQLDGVEPESIQSQVDTLIEAYFKEQIQEHWGAAITNKVEYNLIIYRARIAQILLNNISQIINIEIDSNFTIDGVADNYTCQEDSSIQEVPVLGTVTMTKVV